MDNGAGSCRIEISLEEPSGWPAPQVNADYSCPQSRGPPLPPLSNSLWSADHQVSFVGTVGQPKAWLWQPAGRVDADMSPLVSRHGVKNVENSLGEGERRKKKEWEEKQFVTKNSKI